MGWPKKLNWLWIIAGIVIVGVAIVVVVIGLSSASGTLQNSYGKQLNDAAGD